MTNTVPQQIVDKNGKTTTVHKKPEAPKNGVRPIPAPIPKSAVNEQQRNKDAVKDLMIRLSLPAANFVDSGDVKELQPNVYAVTVGGEKYVAFDQARVGLEVISGMVTKDGAKVIGKLYTGDGTSNRLDERGYALPSAEADVETQQDAAKIAAAHL